MNTNSYRGTLIYKLKGSVEEEFTSIKYLWEEVMNKQKHIINSLYAIESWKDEYNWVEHMWSLLSKHHIYTVGDLVYGSHDLIGVIPNKILKIMTRIALDLYGRSLEDDARKGAFMEANIEFEVVSNNEVHYPQINGISTPKTSIKMKKIEPLTEEEQEIQDNKLQNLLHAVKKTNLIHNLFVLKNEDDESGWMQSTMKIFHNNDIYTIDNLVKRSHELVSKMANDALKVIMKYAVPVHEMNIRKTAFEEADVPFEVISTHRVKSPVMEGESAYSASIIIKKKYNTGNEEATKESVLADENKYNNDSEILNTSQVDIHIGSEVVNTPDELNEIIDNRAEAGLRKDDPTEEVEEDKHTIHNELNERENSDNEDIIPRKKKSKVVQQHLTQLFQSPK